MTSSRKIVGDICSAILQICAAAKAPDRAAAADTVIRDVLSLSDEIARLTAEVERLGGKVEADA